MLRGVDVGRCSYIEERLSTWREASEMREQAQGTRSDPQSTRQSPRIHVPGKNLNPDGRFDETLLKEFARAREH